MSADAVMKRQVSQARQALGKNQYKCPPSLAALHPYNDTFGLIEHVYMIVFAERDFEQKQQELYRQWRLQDAALKKLMEARKSDSDRNEGVREREERQSQEASRRVDADANQQLSVYPYSKSLRSSYAPLSSAARDEDALSRAAAAGPTHGGSGAAQLSSGSGRHVQDASAPAREQELTWPPKPRGHVSLAGP
jgi:hypothetical protein